MLKVEPSNILKDNMDLHIAEALKKYPNAKKIAVENFCWTAERDPRANCWNLNSDANSYRWNSDTIQAIRDVLKAEGKL